MDVGDIAPIIVAIAAFITAGISLWKAKSDRRKTDADAATQIQDAALELLKPFKEEVAELRQEQERLKKVLTRAMSRIAYLMGGIAVLTQQITQKGDTPQWMADDWREECE